MKMNERMKKVFSILLCLCMLVQNFPVVAFAAAEDNLCEHHPVHTAECHYAEAVAGSPCTHTHSEDCYAILACVHTCGDECEDPCTHECTVDSGCITMDLDCHHTHGDCGYSEGTAEVPCGHTHNESCGYVEAVAGNPCANAETDPECDHTGDCGFVAAVEGQPCGHTEHTDCGYAPATEGTPCTHTHAVKVDSADSCYKLLCSHKEVGHDDACGYVAAVEAHECHYECAECNAFPSGEGGTATAVTEEASPAPDGGTLPEGEGNSVCDCGTDDAAIHATTCAVYVAPENPVCYCAEKCSDTNEWCDVCGVDFTICTGIDTAVPYIDDGKENGLIIEKGETLTITADTMIYSVGGDIVVNGGSIYITDAISEPRDSNGLYNYVINSGTVIGTGYCSDFNYPTYIGGTNVSINGGYINIPEIYGAEVITINGDALVIVDQFDIGTEENASPEHIKGVVFVDGVGTVKGDVTLPEDLTVKSGESINFVEGATITNLERLTVEEGATILIDGNEHTHNTHGTVTYEKLDDTVHTVLTVCEGCPVGYIGEATENHSTTAEGDRAATCKELAYCSVCQSEYGEVSGHTPAEDATYTVNNDGTHSFECFVCGETGNEAHDFTGDGTCVCGAACTHSFTDGVCTGCGITGGYCGAEGDGTNLTWKIENDTLIISGTGAMADYSYTNPWSGYAFTNVVIEEGVSTVGMHAFWKNKMTSATIPSSVTVIGQQAFGVCEQLTSITLSEGLLTIDDGAFYSCNALQTITIPASVTNIADDALHVTNSLTTISVAEGNTVYKSIDGSLYSADGTILWLYPHGKTATEFTIPEDVVTIEERALDGAYNLTTVTIPSTVRTIKDFAFRGCSALTTITIPASVTSIGAGAFDMCNALTTVNVPCSWKENPLYVYFEGDVTVNKAEHTPDADSYTDNGDGTHDASCVDCGTVAVDNEAHTIENHVCTACGVMEIVVSFDAGDYEWKTGDQIRLARWTGDSIDDYYFTAEVAEDGTVTWTPDKTLYWNGTDEHTLAVSYPNMNLIYQNFGIPGEQSTLETLREADCMNAIWSGNPTTDPITFNLKHRLAKVTVNYEVAEGVTVSKAEIYTFTQYMLFDVHTLERKDAAWEEGYDLWITSYLSGNQFTAFVSPDAYAADGNFIKITLDNGTVYEVKMNKAVTFAEGEEYTYKVIITADSAYLVCADGCTNFTYIDNEDGTHKKVCSECGYEVTEDHTVTYTASGNVITASCSKCKATLGTATVSAADTIYNGTEQMTATVNYSEGWTGEKPNVSYANNTNAGTATASITLGEATASVDFEITKADAAFTIPEAIANLTYNGSAQALVTPGEVTGGTMQYTLGTDDINAPTNGWNTEIPTAINVGTYYVWYRVQGDSNHNDVDADSVTVTVTCDHTHNTNENYTDNGDGTHDLTCSVCDGLKVDNEAHSGGTQTCMGYKCTACGVWYGEADLSAHAFADDNVTCKYCQQTIVAKVTRDGVVSYYTAIEDVAAGEKGSGTVLTLLANYTLTENKNLWYMTLEREGDVTITVPEGYNLSVCSALNTANAVNWINSVGYSGSVNKDKYVISYRTYEKVNGNLYFLLRDHTIESTSVTRGALNIAEGATLTVTGTVDMGERGQIFAEGTLKLGENATLTNGYTITVSGTLELGKNAVVTNSGSIYLNNAEVYKTGHDIPAGITGGTVEINDIAYTYVSEGSTDEKDSLPYWTCSDHTGGLSEATCITPAHCDNCGDQHEVYADHTINTTTGKCIHCGEYVAVATVTDGTTTLYADGAERLREQTEQLLNSGSRTITVALTSNYMLNYVCTAVSNAVPDESQTVHLTVEGVTEISDSSGFVGMTQLASLSLPDVTYVYRNALRGTYLQRLELTAEGQIDLERDIIDSNYINSVDLVLCCNKTSAVTDGVTWKNFTFKSITYTKHDYVDSVCTLCGAICNHSGSNHTTGTDLGDGKHSFKCTVCEITGIEGHTLTYSASGSTITVSCSANCGSTGTATVKAAGKTYDGTAVTASVEKTGILTGETIGITYSREGAALNESAINAGAYTASISCGGVTASVEFTITKADAAFTVPEAETGLTYDGSAQALVNAGTVEDGTMQYAVGTDGINAPTDGWSTDIPTAIDAGTYYVWYKVLGDSNHNNTDPASLTVTVGQRVVAEPTVVGTYTYTGEEQTVTMDSFESSYMTIASGNKGTDAKDYEAVITLNSNYKWADGSDGKVQWSIAKAKAEISVNTDPITVTYGETVPLPTATTNFGTVTCDKTAADLVNAGTYTVTYTVAGTANFEGDTKTVTVTVNAKTITPTIEGVEASYVYTGETIQPTVTAQDGETVLTEGTDYDVAYGNNTNVVDGGSVTVTLKGNYSGEKTVTFAIAPAPVTIIGKDMEVTYDGKDIDLRMLFTIDENAGEEDYTIIGLTGDGNCTTANYLYQVTKAGNFTVQLTTKAAGNYAAGSATAVLTVNKAAGFGTVELEDWTYGENSNAPTVSGSGEVTLLYTGENYSSNVAPTDAGAYTVTATFEATDLYTEYTASAEFTIAPAAIATAQVTVDPDADLTYTGAAVTPDAAVSLNGKTLVKDTDYTVSYSSNIHTGTAAVTVAGKDNYTGSASATFEIVGNPLSDFTHTLNADGIVTLTKYIGTSASVVVPNTYTVDGTQYRVVLDSTSVFRGNTTITAVLMDHAVGFQNNSMSYLFAECTKLSSVRFPGLNTEGVTDMSWLFYQCTGLKNLDVSDLDTGKVTTMRSMFSYCSGLATLTGYESWDTGSVVDMYQMFNRTTALKKVDLSGWDLDQVKNTGWCFQQAGAEQILLPDNLAVISAGFLNHATKVVGSTYTIPKGVKKIGYAHTIYDFATDDFVEFIVAEGNANYKTIDGILYSMDGSEMLAVPRNKPFADNTYVIPEGVTFLAELSFSRNYNIHKVILPDSYVIEQNVEVYDEDYIVFEDKGNLNNGNSLSIAIYCYTGITEYEVKDTNPNYVSVNGIIYSKDMTQVVAIPTRYAQVITIPEGVTTWNKQAMWDDKEVADQYAMSNVVDQLIAACGGVSIPGTLVSIEEEQLGMLNRLVTKFGDSFVITVDSDNPVYYVDTEGYLKLRTSLADADVSLDLPEVGYTYDGSEKKPGVSVSLNGELLTENTDYAVSYADNVNAGTATVTVTGLGMYTATASKTFTIAKAAQTVTVLERLELSCADVAQLEAQAEGALSFVSSDETIVTVDADGKLTAKKAGSAVITVSAAETQNYLTSQAACRVTVVHAHEPVITAPTCEDKGYTTYTCACGDSYVADYVDAKGHDYDDGVITTRPGCETEGVKTFTCANDATHTYTEKVAAKGHDHKTVVTAPTCEDKGYTTYTCACGDSYVADYVDAKGHAYDDGVITTQPGCETEGVKIFTCANDATHTYTEKVDAKGHDYDDGVITAPTCEDKGYTTYTCACGDSYVADYVDAKGHDYNGGVITTQPGCETDGVKTFTCGNDATHTYTEKVDAKGHDYNGGVITTQPGCETDGVKTFTCGNDATHTYTEKVDAKGHDYDDGVITTQPGCETEGVKTFTCANDATHTYTEKVGAKGHDHKTVVTAPTCEDKGYTTYTCACGDSYVADYVDAKGHDYDDGVITTQPGCETEGVKTYTCANDATHTYTEKVDAKGHDYDDGVITTQPGCETEGVKTFTCTNDKNHTYSEPIPAKGHNPEDAVEENRVEATCTAEGSYEMVVYCAACDEELSRTAHTISAKGHSFGAWTTTKQATCTDKGQERRDCAACDHYESRTTAFAGHFYQDALDSSCETCGDLRDVTVATIPMLRLYNPVTGEHLYTGSTEERDFLVSTGWNYEGVAWNAPVEFGTPVCRYYNPNSGDHHYTTCSKEGEDLTALGWIYEGVAWNSASDDHLPLYRLYNPNTDIGSHHYTGSEEERDMLVDAGWIYEGIGWFGTLR